LPLAVILLLAAAGPWAQRAVAAGVTELTIDHQDPTCRVRQFENGTPRSPQGIPLKENPDLMAGKGNKVLITFEHPNPLLFLYSVKKGAVTKTANEIALESFVGSGLSPFLTALQGGAGGAAPSKDEKAAAKPTCAMRFPVLGTVADVANRLDKDAKDRVHIATISLNDPATAKARVANWLIADQAKTVATAEQEIAGLVANRQGDDCAGLIAETAVALPNLEQAIKDLTAFADLVGQIDQSISIEIFTVDPALIQTVDIEISQTKAWPPGLPTNRFVGKGSPTVEPVSRVSLAVAPALIYSFVKDPTFTTHASGGQFTITKSQSEYKALDLAAMMQIEPTAWDLGPIQPGIQLGISPQKDLGLFLGVSLRATNLFTLGAGLAFQRVDRLQTGLQVGQVISSPDLLKTEKHFQTGLYLHLTVSQKKSS